VTTVFVTGTRALLKIPADITRAVVRTTGAFRAPAGWREVGAMHAGRNVWLITVEREATS
jgi:hypothetical protein